ncbi:hypothetical protein [Lutibaculum baratangense]|uniref:Uncharacterized protein n=1 Tax=Lutibaculum baratangense AMV1 TaxID=631454 RepID=V4RRZ5_9HYPH|nr:hypothetical protein [Lutibaculum baratangense]ESR25890.1 hypothetical protein N177_1225 [Lutibaculum baratangense AMV1]
MDLVTIILSMCIGNVVAWTVALYTEDGMYFLIANVVTGALGAAACGLTIAWLVPDFGPVLFLALSPLAAVLAIAMAMAAWRAIRPGAVRGS